MMRGRGAMENKTALGKNFRFWCGVMMALAVAGAIAQPYPAKPVRFIVPFAPGGASDIVGRAAGQKLSEIWGQAVVVDNRAGGSGQIGTEAVARAAPDGYTLLVVEPTFAIAPSLFSKLPYDTLQDFAYLVQIGQGPQVLVVHPSVPAKNVKELLALARARPGELNFASPGTGTTGHLGMELFKLLGKVDMVHIPYKGAGPAVVDLVGGQVSIGLVSISSAQPNMKAGRLRGLAVTSAKRFVAAPELPTIAEAALPGFDTLQWWGLVAPRATPAAVVNKIAGDVARLAEMPDVRERMLTLGAEPVSSSPERFGAFVRSEIEKWGKLVRASGAKVD
jgi:tripartite-type tricarboxylate transporter receptor subunit TctC